MGDEGEEKPPEQEEQAPEPPAETPAEPAPDNQPAEEPKPPEEPPKPAEEEKPPEEPPKPPEEPAQPPDEAPKAEEPPKNEETPAPTEPRASQDKRLSKTTEGIAAKDSKEIIKSKTELSEEKKASAARLSTAKEKSKSDVKVDKSKSDSKVEKTASAGKVRSASRVSKSSKGSIHSAQEKEGRMTSLSKISEGEEEMKPSKTSILSAESLEKSRSLVDTKDPQRRERLGSKAQRVVGSIISIRRLSGTGDLYDKGKGARYANTYKLESDKPFNHEKVQQILESVMEEALENLTYCPDKCPKQAKWASSAIRAKVKELQYDRYKLVCLVTIGEKNSQDVLVSCRFLWDTDRDSYATYTLENTYVFGIAQCFGIYYE